jgi:hypothetical protein
MRHWLTVLLFGSTACASPPASQVTVDTSRIQAEVFAVFDSMVAAHHANDAELELRQTDAHPDYVSAGDGYYSTDAAADAEYKRERWKNHDDFRYLSEAFEDKRVAVLAPNVAVVNARYRETLQFKAGTVLSIRATWALVLVKRDATWKVLQQYYHHCEAADTVHCVEPKWP